MSSRFFTKTAKKCASRRSALQKKYPPAAPGDTTLYFAGFTIRFTSLFLTKMVLTTLMPSVAFFTLSLSIAAATTAASSLSTGTVTVPFSLPLTYTAISTWLSTVLASSCSGQSICMAILPYLAAKPMFSHISSTMWGAKGLSSRQSISTSPLEQPLA